MKMKLVYRITFLSLLLCFFVIQISEAEDTDIEGYDENTEITIKGTVKEIDTSKRGPVILTIHYKNKPFKVVTAPKWYLHRNNIEFKSGMEVEITGSKFLSKEGTFFISARKIKFTENEKMIELRDSHCRPMWRRMH